MVQPFLFNFHFLRSVRIVLFLTLFVLVTANVNGQAVSDSICWRKDLKLSISDFQGMPDTVGIYKNFSAVSAIRWEGEVFWEDDFPDFRIKVCFIKSQSWMVGESEGLLSHEQFHFNIRELYARKMRKKMNSLRKNKVRTYPLYEENYNRILAEADSVDDLYDMETAHGVIYSEQKRWEEQISKQLEQLKEFSSPYPKY